MIKVLNQKPIFFVIMVVFDFSDEDIILTTSHSLENKSIDEYKGVIVADVTEGRHLGRDFLAGLRNTFGGRSKSWENTLEESQKEALREIVERAKDKGADAVISIEFEDEMVGVKGGMMNVKASGTAVKIKE